jgi:rod shape-determining protein MreC
MLEFVRRNRVLLSSGFFLLCSLGLLSANARQPGRIDPLGHVFLEVMAPFQRVTGRHRRHDARDLRSLRAARRTQAENERLIARIRDLERRGTHQSEMELMNRRLKRLLALERELPTRAVAASVTARDASVWFQSLTLNKGEIDGIQTGMPVIAPEGVIGLISSTSMHASRVLLLTDPNSGIDVLVQRTRVRGILSGLLEEGTTLKYVKRSDDVRVGDRVVASGLDGVFPKGLRSVASPRCRGKTRPLPLRGGYTRRRCEPSRRGAGRVAERGGAPRPALLPRAAEAGPPGPDELGLYGPPAPVAKGEGTGRGQTR